MIKKHIVDSIKLRKVILSDVDFINQINLIIKKIVSCFENGGKILIAGNGGSAADAQHFAAEFMGRYLLTRKGYPAIALTADTSFITAWSNDFNFDTIFSRQIEALAKAKDLFIGISTSGNSINIINAIKTATKLGIESICLLGKDGGKLKEIANTSLIVPSGDTALIQEVHIMLIHIICEEVEKIIK